VSEGRPVFPIGEILFTGQSQTTGETLWNKVVLSEFPHGNTEISAGDCAALDITDIECHLEFKNEEEQRKLHPMANIYNFLQMWQGSQSLGATQKESRSQKTPRTDIGYILHAEDIIK
jgi:hypothetical protein